MCVHSKTPGFIIGKTEKNCWRTLQIKTANNFVNNFIVAIVCDRDLEKLKKGLISVKLDETQKNDDFNNNENKYQTDEVITKSNEVDKCSNQTEPNNIILCLFN